LFVSKNDLNENFKDFKLVSFKKDYGVRTRGLGRTLDRAIGKFIGRREVSANDNDASSEGLRICA